MNDQTLSDTTPPASAPPRGNAGGVFAHPERPDIDLDAPIVPMTVEQILEQARLPERRARVCLRADLQARYDELVAELGTLVNSYGELLEEAEASLGEATAKARAVELGDEIQDVRRQMAASMWRPLFRGKSSDDLAVFNKKHYPAEPGASLTDYHNLLIAECCVDTRMTVEDVAALRQKFGHKAIRDLIETASQVNVGGVDVPKSPISSPVSTGR